MASVPTRSDYSRLSHRRDIPIGLPNDSGRFAASDSAASMARFTLLFLLVFSSLAAIVGVLVATVYRLLVRIMGSGAAPVVHTILGAVCILGWVLISVLVIILLLRKVLGFIQARVGPIRTGPQGAFQTIADAMKLLFKEDVIPTRADRWVFTLAPFLVFVPAYMVYAVIPFGDNFVTANLNIGLLYIAAITSIAVIGIVMAGWSSDNKYSLLGGMRSAAQMVSYEIPVVLSFLPLIVLTGSLNLNDVVRNQAGGFWNWHLFAPFPLIIPGFIGFIVYLIGSLAEISHTPFDLPEAESELVSGYNTEYSGMKFAFFFLAEFAASFTVCAIGVTLFLGGWNSGLPFLPSLGVWGIFWFMLKAWTLMFALIWIRGTLPRVRVDQLMEMGWKFLIPVQLVNFLVVAALVALFGFRGLFAPQTLFIPHPSSLIPAQRGEPR